MIIKTKHDIHTLLFLTALIFFLSTTTSPADNINLIYKGCADQKLQEPYSQNLKPLLSSLVAESAQKGFAATTQNGLTGAYQCRGDLTGSDCHRVTLNAVWTCNRTRARFERSSTLCRSATATNTSIASARANTDPLPAPVSVTTTMPSARRRGMRTVKEEEKESEGRASRRERKWNCRGGTGRKKAL